MVLSKRFILEIPLLGTLILGLSLASSPAGAGDTQKVAMVLIPEESRTVYSLMMVQASKDTSDPHLLTKEIRTRDGLFELVCSKRKNAHSCQVTFDFSKNVESLDSRRNYLMLTASGITLSILDPRDKQTLFRALAPHYPSASRSPMGNAFQSPYDRIYQPDQGALSWEIFDPNLSAHPSILTLSIN